MKAELSLVEKSAKEVGVPAEKLREMLERIQDELAVEKEPKQAIKKQFVILVSDPQGFLKGHDFAGFVVQIEESEHPSTAEKRIHEAAYDFNESKRGRLLPVQTVGEACESVPSRTFKEFGVWIKTKTPVLVVTTNNELPNVEKLTSGVGN